MASGWVYVSVTCVFAYAGNPPYYAAAAQKASEVGGVKTRWGGGRGGEGGAGSVAATLAGVLVWAYIFTHACVLDFTVHALREPDCAVDTRRGSRLVWCVGLVLVVRWGVV